MPSEGSDKKPPVHINFDGCGCVAIILIIVLAGPLGAVLVAIAEWIGRQ